MAVADGGETSIFSTFVWGYNTFAQNIRLQVMGTPK